MQQSSKDRRRFARYKSDERFSAIIPLESTPYPVATIVDISDCGMSFRYLGTKRLNTNLSTIDIFHEGKPVIKDIPIVVVSDNILISGEVSMRRCGVLFNKNSSLKTAALKKLIKNHFS